MVNLKFSFMARFIFSLCVFILTLGCKSSTDSARSSGSAEDEAISSSNVPVPPFIIDAHIHYRPTDEWKKSFVEVYTRYNAMGVVMVKMDDLERGIKFAKANPETVIPYAQIDIDSPTVLEDVKKVHSMGYRGLGEFFAKNQWSYDDPKYEPLWSLAEELGMPLAPHTGNLSNGMMANLRPASLATIAANHPNLIIVGAHFGNPWYAEAAEAARRNSNLYFDMSGSSLIKKEHDPGIWKEYLWWTPYVGKDTPHMPKDLVPAFEKIVFASDEDPDALEENFRRFNKVLDANNVSEETQAKCYGLTMARILGIDVDEIKQH